MQARVAVNRPASSWPYTAPFIVFIALLGIQPHFQIGQRPWLVVWATILPLALWVWARPVIDLRLWQPGLSLVIGAGVFALWILPDLLFSHYREHWLFTNPLTGSVGSSIPPADRSDAVVLLLRSLRAVFFVPVIEELFWRGWLMRWLISHDFASVPLGAYQPSAFWITALLFAAEHGPYWDVGLLAGVVYNWWMVRTRSLGDCILAHAVTNGCLCAYIISAHRWEYWL